MHGTQDYMGYYSSASNSGSNSDYTREDRERKRYLHSQKQLFDRDKKSYKNLMKQKVRNMDLLENDFELALKFTLVESCYTYVYENNYRLNNKEKSLVINNLTKAKQGLKRLANFTKLI